MRDSPVRNIFLPAALVAGSVFSALMLPTILEKSTNSPVKSLPVLSQAAQMNLEQIHKDAAIPYIGTAIVLSAGAGVITAELARKHWTKGQKAAQLATQSTQGQPIPSHTQALESGFKSEAIAGQTVTWPSTETFIEAWPEILASDEATAAIVEAEASHTVIIFPGQYQRCRVQVPRLPEQLYAIEFDEQFYSLLSAGIPKNEALEAVDQLAQENRAAILTRMNQGYAVWVLEPQAQFVSAA
ncbi:hypothetical protein [Sphaerothrix gracilis]|uniref:hypothetical protein n=1 Tax=Sphaerothrix gracilis TaxID=3151835 RepID=UPI0031FDA18C